MSNNSINILVPNLPESVSDATVAAWHKKEGEKVKQNEILVEIETDKIMLEVPASENGILEKISAPEGALVISGDILGKLILINNNYEAEKINVDNEDFEQKDKKIQSSTSNNHDVSENIQNENTNVNNLLSPSIRKLIAEHDLNIQDIQGSGIKGRVTKQDIETYIHKKHYEKIHENNHNDNKHLKTDGFDQDMNHNHSNTTNKINDRQIKRVTMSRLRKKIAERLINVTNSTAMLTTFNEVNMQFVIKLRNKYKELFEKRYGTKLSFMSFFVKAVLEGLKYFPEINASIDGEEIIYYNYFDISIAISTDRGLITPVLRNVNVLNFADIDQQIQYLVQKGRNGQLNIEDLKGGNFTITNGGVFGSLMSTPIINPPQSAILGMHAIQDRPIVLDGKIKIFPMMYLALSYDHRLIDGKDAISFLVTIKKLVEDPIRLILGI